LGEKDAAVKLSRRSLGKRCVAMMAASAIPRELWAIFAPPSTGAQHSDGSAAGLPKFVVEDFSKVFDPAYLSNGVIGIRPGPNALARAQACVSGFVFLHPAPRVETLSPAPYPLQTDIRVNGVSLLKRHDSLRVQRQTLDTSCGELTTRMEFAAESGVRLDVEVLQFASRSVPSLVCQQIRVVPSADTEIEFIPTVDAAGVPGKLDSTEAPERTAIDLVASFESAGGLSELGMALWITTPEARAQREQPFATESGVSRSYVLKGRSGQAVRFQTIAAMVSDLYHPEPLPEAIRMASWGSLLGFEGLRSQNRSAWAELWESRVKVTGDAEAQRVLDAAFFYLHSSLHSSTRTGMPPFGLSQSAYYYGHSFWDTETWSLLPVTLAAPATAKSLLDFRVRGLDYAERLAALYGYRGAQFPWEAAPTKGFETTPTFAGTGWGEQHVTPDVALGFWEYQLATNDAAFLRDATWPVLRRVAEWIESRGIPSNRGFEIQNIMGPAEDVPNVSNASYMNAICKMVLSAAIRCAQMAGASAPSSWAHIRDAFVLPVDKSKNVMLPYDNPPSPSNTAYSTGQLDMLTLHDPPIPAELLRSTHDMEETVRQQRAAALGRSQPEFVIGFAEAALSATAAFLGEKRAALEHFHRSWKSSWLEPFGMIRETPAQDHGCFLTDYGSLLQTAMLGFTGLRITEGDWRKYPAALPAGWSKIEIERIFIRGEAKRLVAVDGAPAKLFDFEEHAIPAHA
jgi:protein-glucosylgalactosylhydroxylysine glucosidase